MKKSVKYYGIIAAALLAVSPVVANTTISQNQVEAATKSSKPGDSKKNPIKVTVKFGKNSKYKHATSIFYTSYKNGKMLGMPVYVFIGGKQLVKKLSNGYPVPANFSVSTFGDSSQNIISFNEPVAPGDIAGFAGFGGLDKYLKNNTWYKFNGKTVKYVKGKYVPFTFPYFVKAKFLIKIPSENQGLIRASDILVGSKKSAVTKVNIKAKIKGKKNKKIRTYTSTGKLTKKYVYGKKTYKFTQRKTIKGKVYYKLNSKNQWVPASKLTIKK